MKRKVNSRVSVLRSRIDGIPGAAVAAFVGTRFAGSVIVSHLNSKAAAVTSLYVGLDYRRNGIGRKLLGACETLARARKCECIGLIVQGKNPAQYFYRKAGYAVAYEYGDKSLLMSKPLL